MATTIPRAPGAIPLIGNSVQLLRDPIEFLKSLPASEDLVQIRIGPMKAIVLLDRELTQEVLRDDRTFDKGGPFFDRLREIMGNGLGTSPRDVHRRQRRMIQPAFHISRMPGYVNIMGEQIAAVTGSWRDGQVIDGYSEMLTITAKVVLATMFSDSMPPDLVRETTGNFVTIVRTMYKRMIMPPPLDKLPLPDKRRYDACRAFVKDTVNRIVAERRVSGEDRGDLLSVLLSERDDAGEGLSGSEIHDHLCTFFLAGVMTTASALSWTLHLLTQHRDVQSQLQAETNAVLKGADPTFQDVQSLDVTKRVIAESLRLWSPGWFVTRVSTTESVLAGHTIPAGTTIIYSPYMIHRDGDVYPDPESYDPDRWLPERAADVPRNAHIPFGEGPRKCIADIFSLTQSSLVISSIAAKWDLEPASSEPVRPALGAVLAPRGLRIRVTSRA
ncbi:cytochrome P450 [Streptomyces hygroscopicus subsp. sporocinereus]|uniref:Cytochrome P450 n=1 Tax=Streptomyces hygroscopicus TaxID=1912 RepID=A0ABQ3TU77_STRHY|nr:cytochrome P450 [Streptomyces hygroscopicus]GHJ26875.1 cytochrome P450 [Streptomyces hygroscopicus]